jgi:hypothetical protein
MPRLDRAMNRDEHVEWTKQRAILELESGEPRAPLNAIASVQSDLSKHPETRRHPAIELMGMLAMNGHLNTDAEIRSFIDGIR